MKYGMNPADFNVIIEEIVNNLGNTKNAKAFVYGSRVKGTARPFSDIDILLKADSYDKKALSRIDFTELNTPYKVDFVLDEDLFEAYRNEIYSHMEEVELKTSKPQA